MNWEEVRRIYPNTFVKLYILESHMEGNRKYIDDMAIIKAFNDNKEASKELVRSEENTVVYHTSNETIFVLIKKIWK